MGDRTHWNDCWRDPAHHGRLLLGMLTSVGIGVAQIATFRLLPTASTSEMIAWIAAGPVANLAAQWIKRHDIEKIRRLHK